jgi:hypothetical protein
MSLNGKTAVVTGGSHVSPKTTMHVAANLVETAVLHIGHGA